MLTGSILNINVANAIVWGCGLDTSTDLIPEKREILAVRGRLTGDILKSKGIQFNQVYGDPCLLLPRVYKPEIAKVWKLGIIPHVNDIKYLYDKLKMNDKELEMYGIKIIDIRDDVESVIRNILSCRNVISSSLYGLMVSHAYFIPCEWVKFTSLVKGDDFKFLDYFSSIQSDKRGFIDLRLDKLTIELLTALSNYNNAQAPLLNIDLNALWNCCPFRY